MAAKTDWYDDAEGRVLENPASLQLFPLVAKPFRAKLRRPVRACNDVTGKCAAHRIIGYTEGAAEWVTRGGRLRQSGIANIEFFLDDPSAS